MENLVKQEPKLRSNFYKVYSFIKWVVEYNICRRKTVRTKKHSHTHTGSSRHGVYFAMIDAYVCTNVLLMTNNNYWDIQEECKHEKHAIWNMCHYSTTFVEVPEGSVCVTRAYLETDTKCSCIMPAQPLWRPAKPPRLFSLFPHVLMYLLRSYTTRFFFFKSTF